ncbi:17925_t:CDS:1, partial [Funneliformis caledonium]
MIFIIFQVYEGLKSLAQPKIKEVDEGFFSEVFDVVTSGAYMGKAVQVS